MVEQDNHEPTISARLSACLERPVLVEDRQRAVLHLIDWTACAIAGSRERAGQIFLETFASKACDSQAMRLGALGGLVESDDVDKRALLHPGPVIFPAALAVCTQETSAEEFLDAIVFGYEAAIRVGRAVGPGHYRFWHNTATCTGFGAAVTAAKLLHLSSDGIQTALGLAGTQAAGLWQVRHEEGSEAKALHFAHSAMAGVNAARLARSGLIGIPRIFEGTQGFFAAMCPGADPLQIVSDEYGDRWLIHEVSFKPWPACRHVHAAIDAAIACRRNVSDLCSIAAVEVFTYRDAIAFCDKPEPKDAVSARFSLQHSVAVALCREEVPTEAFSVHGIVDAAIARVRRRVSVHVDDEFSRRYPARFGARVVLRFADGAIVESTRNDALGDPENPMSAAQIIEKAHGLMRAASLRQETSTGLIESMQLLGHDGDLCVYRDQLAAVLLP